jgi:hypothetical protein
MKYFKVHLSEGIGKTTKSLVSMAGLQAENHNHGLLNARKISKHLTLKSCHHVFVRFCVRNIHLPLLSFGLHPNIKIVSPMNRILCAREGIM